MDDQTDRCEVSDHAFRSGAPTGRTAGLLDTADLFKRRPKSAYQVVPDSALLVNHDHEDFTKCFTNGCLGKRICPIGSRNRAVMEERHEEHYKDHSDICRSHAYRDRDRPDRLVVVLPNARDGLRGV